MTTHHPLIAPCFVLLASACGSGDGAPSLSHYGAEMADSVEVVAQAVSDHHAGVLAEQDLGRIPQLEAAHMQAMNMGMGRMRDANDSMTSCSEHMSAMGQGHPPQTFHDAQGGMDDAMAGMTVELERHMSAMNGSATVEAAHEEERRHQGVMTGVTDRMRMHDDELGAAMRAMQDAGSSMMCSMDSHMHR